GKSKYFLTEACEYERSFLNLYPKIIILNNIELDHTDYYKDLDDMKSAFKEFVSHLPEDGTLIINGDNKEITNPKFQIPNKFKIPNSKFKILRFGLSETNNVRADNIEFGDGEVKFNVVYNNKDLGEFILKVPGLFNIYNALSAISLGLVLEIPVDTIKKSLKNYSGIWRRFEIKGEYKKALVISDYAHHPTAVKVTIEAARQFYPGKRIFAVFQPHQHNRTKKLYKDFLNSFNDADVLILTEIFDVAGREENDDQNISSRNLAEDLRKKIPPLKKGVRGIFKLNSDSIFYAKDLEKTRKLIDENIKPDDILLIMGAGDIYKIADDSVR
ncbi:MAG: UDP-N-acetylmuramate--L-alanine ligase, partial [Deltaproteobacteria bacterium]|nr:UDP-N-acetylmuramate--L-alanine ligase [Deltaproteobacteria bacterium]